jgi:hypothetical protein
MHPVPVLLSGLRTFVAFYLSVRDPPSDGTSPRGRDPQADHGIGVVEFKRMTSVKVGSPNDEVLRGHPLWGCGLEFYSAHEVMNSPWITELMEVDRAQEHFEESQLECVAKWTIARTAPGATIPEVLTYLKHCYGWNRIRLDSRTGAAIWCGHGVFAHNLVKIGILAS